MLALGILVLWIWFNRLSASCLLIGGWVLACLELMLVVGFSGLICSFTFVSRYLVYLLLLWFNWLGVERRFPCFIVIVCCVLDCTVDWFALLFDCVLGAFDCYWMLFVFIIY